LLRSGYWEWPGVGMDWYVRLHSAQWMCRPCHWHA
jgi:hypothetical protein